MHEYTYIDNESHGLLERREHDNSSQERAGFVENLVKGIRISVSQT